MASDHEIPRVPWIILLAFLLLALGIGLTGYHHYDSHRREVWQEKAAELAAIAELKVDTIARWRKERLGDGEGIRNNRWLIERVWKWLRDRYDPRAASELTVWMETLCKGYGYRNALLLDSSGTVRLSLVSGESLGDASRLLAVNALERQQSQFSDLYRDRSGQICLELAAPLVLEQEDQIQKVGVILLEIDPFEFLYPTLQSWPTPSWTSETLMVRKEGNEVLFLNELRHKAGTTLLFRLPLERRDVPAVRAVEGIEEVSEGVDYRGVSVLAASRRITGSPWFLVSKVDTEEIYAPSRQRAWYVLAVAILLIAFVGAGIGLRWRHQLAVFYQARLAVQIERHELEKKLFTERREAEEVLRKSEASLLRAQEIGHVGSWEVDLSKNSLTWSCETFRIYGLNPEQFSPTREQFYALVHPEDRERVRGISQEAVATRQIYQVEHRIIRPDGVVRVVVENAQVQLDQSGQAVALLGTVQDVTEHKQADESLRASEERLRAIFHEAAVCMMVLDSAGRVQEVNRAMQYAFGYTTQELHQMTLDQLVHLDDLTQIVSNYDTLGSGKANRTALSELRFIYKDGQILWGRHVASAIRGPDGQLLSVVVMIEDISERHRLEEQLLQSQKMEGIGRLAGGIAHDFNNLLTAILGYAALTEVALPRSDPLRDHIAEIVKAANRAASLTRQLLAFARRQIIAPKIVDLNELVLNTDKILRRLIGEDIELVVLTDPALRLVKVDPGQFEQILINLAVNARDAMPEGGQLTIETRNIQLDSEYAMLHAEVVPGPHVLLAVSDTGLGMSEEVRTRIFEPFFTTKEQGKGTGLGLATCYGIVKQAGGHIWVYSEPGNGTTFKIYLPQAEAGSSQEEMEDISLASGGGHETILLVEDELLVRTLAARALQAQGYTVLMADTSSEAQALIRGYSGKIDLLLTDVVMPQMSGKQLAELFAKERPGSKVLYMSGYTENAIVHHGVLEEGVAFLPKPFTPGALVRKVTRILGG